ncbi:hypothetical protein EW093_05170 [Thiospirochaeta perfilievii]|uniref:Uncharacterized protein n=1 Tax=Thiospirochaeta perfilievii TaxID=252967 RepID=A0A5C1Q7V4_9SPIO|nr:hypothetical protein [Thiospirochaeta perfilievii]QEN04115.1 hypothetical protein EW093_05170 [Thiospirochaeta perfilievii]
MKVIKEEDIYDSVYRSILNSGVILPKDVSNRIVESMNSESGVSKTVLSSIVENLECAKKIVHLCARIQVWFYSL